MGLVLLSQGAAVTYNDVLSFKTKDEVRVKCRLKLRFIAGKTYKDEIFKLKDKVIALTKAYLEKRSFGEFVHVKALNKALAEKRYLRRVNLIFSHTKIKRVYAVNVRRTAENMPERPQAAAAPQGQASAPTLSPSGPQAVPSARQQGTQSRPTPQPAAPTDRTDAWK